MKTFNEWLREDRSSIYEEDISDYLEYAFDCMKTEFLAEKITDLPMLYNPTQFDWVNLVPYSQQIKDAEKRGYNKRSRESYEASHTNWGKGYQKGKEAGKKISSGYGSLKLGERAINCDEYYRLIRQDEEAKGAFDRGYKEANSQYRYARTTPKIEKAARECAMTYCPESGRAFDAIRKLRLVLNISPDDVRRKHGLD